MSDLPAVRGSNRAVTEYSEALAQAEHDLEMAQQRIASLRQHAAGPPHPATCCYRWEWVQLLISPHWHWELRPTCAVQYDGECWSGCDHAHHADDAPPIAIG